MHALISIHALLAESDRLVAGSLITLGGFLSTLSLRRATTLIWDVIAVMTISIHALLAESDAETPHQAANGLAFLSTLSLRRATHRFRSWLISRNNFYPRSPCGERLDRVFPDP
mgnify:CR=1 FL=1